MPEVIVCTSVIRAKMYGVYETVKTFSMSSTQLADLYNIEVRTKIKAAPLTQAQATVLMNFAMGMLEAFIHVIETDHCEVVCRGADGAVHKGANSAGTGLRWKGTDFLFTAIEVLP